MTAFAAVANREILKVYGRRNSCIFSAAVVCDVLNHFQIHAEPLRVSAAVFPDGVRHCTSLGSAGDSPRQPAARPGMWGGHLVSLVEGDYLVDTTLDQVNRRGFQVGATPVVIYLPDTSWGDADRPGHPTTGLLRLFPGSDVRYDAFHRQNGWKSAGDFQPGPRKAIVARLIKMSRWW